LLVQKLAAARMKAEKAERESTRRQALEDIRAKKCAAGRETEARGLAGIEGDAGGQLERQ